MKGMSTDGREHGGSVVEPGGDGVEVHGLAPGDLRATQRFVVLLGQLGLELTAAIQDAVGDHASNTGVVTLNLLDLEGPKRPGEIQMATGLSSGGVSKLLDRLEGAGLVDRSLGSIPDDRRGVVVSITPEGHRVSLLIAAAIRSRFDEMRVFMKEFAALAEA
jgi:DNA-binding MarR family transcriptional regulator